MSLLRIRQRDLPGHQVLGRFRVCNRDLMATAARLSDIALSLSDRALSLVWHRTAEMMVAVSNCPLPMALAMAYSMRSVGCRARRGKTRMWCRVPASEPADRRTLSKAPRKRWFFLFRRAIDHLPHFDNAIRRSGPFDGLHRSNNSVTMSRRASPAGVEVRFTPGFPSRRSHAHR